MKRKRIYLPAAFMLLAAIFTGIAMSRGRHEVLYKNHPVSYWTAQLSNMDPVARNEAVSALRAMGPEAIAELDLSARRKPLNFESRFASTLHGLPRPLIHRLHLLLRRDEAKVRRLNAIRGLEVLGPDTIQTIPALESALVDPDISVSTAAAIALSRLNAHGVSALVRALNDRNPAVRANACYALGLIGPPAKEAIPELWKICEREIGPPSFQACDSLARIREAAVPFLARQLEGPEARLRELAAYALGMIGPYAEEAIPALTRHAKDRHVAARKRIVSALANIQPSNPAASDALLHALDDAEPGIRLDALRGVEASPRAIRSGTALLVRTLGDTDPFIRGEAAFILGQQGARGTNFIPDLQKLLDDSNQDVRRKAEQALKTIKLSSNQ